MPPRGADTDRSQPAALGQTTADALIAFCFCILQSAQSAGDVAADTPPTWDLVCAGLLPRRSPALLASVTAAMTMRIPYGCPEPAAVRFRTPRSDLAQDGDSDGDGAFGIPGVPEDDRGDEQVKAGGTMLLVLVAAVAYLASLKAVAYCRRKRSLGPLQEPIARAGSLPLRPLQASKRATSNGVHTGAGSVPSTPPRAARSLCVPAPSRTGPSRSAHRQSTPPAAPPAPEPW